MDSDSNIYESTIACDWVEMDYLCMFQMCLQLTFL